MNPSFAALSRAGLSGYTASRALAELGYAYELAKLHPELAAAVDAACEKLYASYTADGTITKAALSAMESDLAPLSPIAKALRVILCAHAHIDMNWMWGFHETASLTIDTFRTMLDLMREYPTFTFSQSQASVYKIVEQYAPDMLDEIRTRVHEGRWEVTASTWVETDKNMPDGESLSRHILRTKRYLSSLLDIDPAELKIDFEPDTFGHNANVPEICAAGGVSYYYHCRGYDGHNIYRWRAASGAELLCYREPVWYNANISPDDFAWMPSFAAKNGISTALKVYGVGDHGGGPTRRDVERLLDMATWPIQPTLTFGTFREFFDTLNERRDTFPVVEGELNYVFTGCYTSQSRIKNANRVAEARMNEAEALLSMDSAFTGAKNPASALHPAWGSLLFNHFHDIIPGSGTVDTREYAMGQFQQTMAAVDTQARRAMRSVAAAVDTSVYAAPSDPESFSEGAGVGFAVGTRETNAGAFDFPQTERGGGSTRILHVFNTTAYPRRESVTLTVWDYPANLSEAVLTDASGKAVPFTHWTEKAIYWGHVPSKIKAVVEVPAFGYTTLILSAGQPADVPFIDHNPRTDDYSDAPLILDNGILRAVFDRETMALVSLIDLSSNTILIDRPAATFRDITEDPSHGMTAWRVGDYAQNDCINAKYPVCVTASGSDFIEYSVKYRENSIRTRVSLDAESFALRYDIAVDWFEHGSHERGIPQLGFSVPLAWVPDSYRYDIPYGEISRASISHDVPASSYAAAFRGNSNLFLWADSKYGFCGCNANGTAMLFCDLLRASYDPDPTPELGAHHITLCIGAAPNGDLFRASTLLNHPLHFISGTAHSGKLALTSSLFTVAGNARLYAVKNAEESGVILRLMGLANGTASVTFASPIKSASLTDTNERIDSPIGVSGNAFEIPISTGKLYTVRVELA